MLKTYTIGSYDGIPVKLHWSLSLLFLFLFYFGREIIHLDNTGLSWFLVLVLTLFLSVIFHEYGHALVAKKFGIKTKDIILSPVGGIARLEHIPKRPRHEIIVALAGPLVNLCIAFLLLIILVCINYPFSIPSDSYPNDFFEFLRVVFWLNLILFAFNLIPAFPMDGGRVLRALLRTRMGTEQATKYASFIGSVIAIAILAFAISLHYNFI